MTNEDILKALSNVQKLAKSQEKGPKRRPFG